MLGDDGGGFGWWFWDVFGVELEGVFDMIICRIIKYLWLILILIFEFCCNYCWFLVLGLSGGYNIRL